MHKDWIMIQFCFFFFLMNNMHFEKVIHQSAVIRKETQGFQDIFSFFSRICLLYI